MHVVLLGTAAGGGFPQWNCHCRPCEVARRHPERARPRTQDSVAVSADGERWFLLNASPDVGHQIDTLRARPSEDALRHSPIESVVLSDAELDHTMGLLTLRQSDGLSLIATSPTLAVLESDTRMLPVLREFTTVRERTLTASGPPKTISLDHRDGTPSGLTVSALPMPGDSPRFASRQDTGPIAIIVEDRNVVGWPTLTYAPGCAALEDETIEALRAAEPDLLLFDGTFWSEDELAPLGSDRGARAMGHVPVSGPTGSLERLSQARFGTRIVYVHINNTNPVLIEDSEEHGMVAAAGIEIGYDGMRVELA